MAHIAPELDAIRRLRADLGDTIVRTPVVRCAGLEEILENGTTVYGKLEFLQRTGTFKARAALATLQGLDGAQRARGVTAVSAGNHAIATAFAAREAGTSAKVIMIATANPCRIEACRAFGAEIVMADDAHSAFELAKRVETEEGRLLVHPFEGPAVAAGTGTLGLEICEQCADFDTVVVAVGGGGLIGGLANAVKALRPDCGVIGVEATGADSMHKSFEAGEPVAIDKVDTIADSLGAPFAMPYSYALCRANVDRLTKVDDVAMRKSMGALFKHMKIAVEPACAATTAALLGPLRDSLRGQCVMLVFCGSNIDWRGFVGQAILD